MRRWGWLVVLLVGVVLFEAVRRVLLVTQNPNLVPSLILLGAAVAPAAFVTFVLGRRLDYSIGAGPIALVAFLGGVVGVVAAGLLEFDALRSLGALPMLGVALIEESAKLVAPLVVLLVTARRGRAADGLLVGVASGAGFAALETMGYGFVVLVRSNGDLGAVDDVLLLRGVLSPAAHMAWTGLTAAALWYLARRRTGRALLVLVVAVALHTTWDSVGGFVAYGVLAVVSLGLLTGFAHRLPHRAPDAVVPA
ncbi:PrsW family glutamic-type intramembrane protease [Pseudonocardia sp. ICBG1293]|uniref:PrsW family glutamic-type intramembrane protease n=1 Tax=Pseudonocardia sp. ICBG1293 TaxID=2844382 RepID=UPI001CCAAED3|nr:PrsW family glutamic-type intramembrane protease [Pseudonocardia sp. ICBG1293]